MKMGKPLANVQRPGGGNDEDVSTRTKIKGLNLYTYYHAYHQGVVPYSSSLRHCHREVALVMLSMLSTTLPWWGGIYYWLVPLLLKP